MGGTRSSPSAGEAACRAGQGVETANIARLVLVTSRVAWWPGLGTLPGRVTVSLSQLRPDCSAYFWSRTRAWKWYEHGAAYRVLARRGRGPGRVDPVASAAIETCLLFVFSKSCSRRGSGTTWIGLPRTGALGLIIDQLTRTKHVRELSIHRDDGIAKEIRNNLNVLVYLG